MSKWRVVGVRTLKPKLEKMVGTTLKNARRLVKTHAMKIEAVAINLSPANTGQLRATVSSGFSSDGLEARVGSTSRYAKYLEFGTAVKGQLTYPAAMQGLPGRTESPASVGYIYGTRHFPAPRYLRRWAKLKLGDANLAFVVARSIAAPPSGLRARPFLGPPFLIEKPKFINNLNRLVKNMGRNAK